MSDEKLDIPTPRDVALRVAKFVDDHYGEMAGHPNTLEGLWMAMQLVGGPFEAAKAMRYCGVNFADK